MSVSDSFEKSDTSSNSSRNVKSPHTVLKENQSIVEVKLTHNNNVSVLIKEDQVDHYVRLLKETEVTLQDKESTINILKQQIKKVEDSLRNTLDELQDIHFKYNLTQQELSNLKQISEKYKEDVRSTLLRNSGNDTEVRNTVTEEIQVDFGNSNLCDFSSIKSDYGNLNKAMQEQNEKIELLLKELKNEFERNQEKNNSQPGTSTETTSYAKCSVVNKLIDENKKLKDALNKLQNENKQLIQKENNDEIDKLQNELLRLQFKINQVNESNAQLQEQIKTGQTLNRQPLSECSKDCSYTPEKNKKKEGRERRKSDDQLHPETNEEPKAHYYRGREGSKVGFRVESNQFESDLIKENKELHHTLNHLRILHSQEDEIPKLQSEIIVLNEELKDRDEKLNDLKSVLENESANRSKIIEEFTEKENQLTEDYNKILNDQIEVTNQLTEKDNELIEKDDLIEQLQNDMKELKLSMNEMVFGPGATTNLRTQELKMSIQTLNTLLAKSMEEKQQYIDELANHANCKNTIDTLNKELLDNTEEIEKLNKTAKDLNETVFDMTNTLEQYEEEVEFRKTENNKLKENENQLQDKVKNLKLENKDLDTEIEKTTSVIIEVLQEYNDSRKQFEEKIKQLSITNADLKKSLLRKDVNIEELKNEKAKIREDLDVVMLRHKRETLTNERSLTEISDLVRGKEEELEMIAEELKLKETNLKILEEENNTLKRHLSDMKEEAALKENKKSDYDTSKYIEQLNEIKILSMNYDKAVKRNEELNAFLNKVSEELKELKLNLHKLLEDLEMKLVCLKEKSELSNSLNPVSRNDINDMGECIKAFSKSICVNHEIANNLKADESNQIVRVSKSNKNANSMDANNLMIKRNYLIKRIESIDEQINQINSKLNDMKNEKSECDCTSSDDNIDSLAFKRQNYIEQIDSIDKDLKKYSIHCECDLSKNYTAPSLHMGTSLQIMQQMTISLCNMKEQLTTKIRDYIINKDQVIQDVNYEKVVQDIGVQCEVNDGDNHIQQINKPKIEKQNISKQICSCKEKKSKILQKYDVQEESVKIGIKDLPTHIETQTEKPLINKSKNDKHDNSKHKFLCPCESVETTILYKYEKPTRADKAVGTETQKAPNITPENNVTPKQKADFEPKLPHTLVKESNPNHSKTVHKDSDEVDKDKSCSCGIILEL